MPMGGRAGDVATAVLFAGSGVLPTARPPRGSAGGTFHRRRRSHPLGPGGAEIASFLIWAPLRAAAPAGLALRTICSSRLGRPRAPERAPPLPPRPSPTSRLALREPRGALRRSHRGSGLGHRGPRRGGGNQYPSASDGALSLRLGARTGSPRAPASGREPLSLQAWISRTARKQDPGSRGPTELP